MPTDDDTPGGNTAAFRERTGPRHAAPRKPLFARLHMPAGKAIALAAMPTAVIMGMSFTPTLARADDQSSSNSLTAEEYKDCVAAMTKDASASPSPSASASASAETEADSKSDSKEDSKADSKDSSSSDSGSDEKGSTGSSSDDSKGGTGESSPSPSPSPSESSASPSPSASSKGVLETIGDALTDVLTGGSSSSNSSGSSSTDSGTTTPSPSPSASEKTESKAESKEETTPSPSPSASDATKDTSDSKDTSDASPSPSPTPSASESSDTGKDDTSTDGCPAATTDAADGIDNKLPLPTDPWYLNASSLLLKGADYQGIVKVKTADGTVKEVLKYVISDGTDIGDLHQTVIDKRAGKTYHVAGGKGTTSTIRDGQTVMYTESISGNLFGLIPVTFSPKSPPPLNIPLIYFTNVKVQQAGQFGGTLTIPQMSQYTS